MLKRKELQKLNKQELTSKLEDLKKQMMKINFQISTGTPPENPGQVKSIKKTIARIQTKINQQEVKRKRNE